MCQCNGSAWCRFPTECKWDQLSCFKIFIIVYIFTTVCCTTMISQHLFITFVEVSQLYPHNWFFMRNKLCASSSAAMLKATFSLVVLLYDHENEINIEILKRKDIRLIIVWVLLLCLQLHNIFFIDFNFRLNCS